MRLPWRLEITQPAGVAHGGAIAALIDSVVVPAIGGGLRRASATSSTIDLQIQYMAAMIGEDAVAEGWITQRGRSIVFCEADVVGATHREAHRPGHAGLQGRQPAATRRPDRREERRTDGVVRASQGTMRTRTLLTVSAVTVLLGGVGVVAVGRGGGSSCSSTFTKPGPDTRSALGATAVLGAEPGAELGVADGPAAQDMVRVAAAAGHPVRWVASTAGAGSVTVTGDRVVLVASRARLWPSLKAYDLSSGALRWARDLPKGTQATVLPVDGATAILASAKLDGDRRVTARLGLLAADGTLLACRSIGADDGDPTAARTSVAGDGHSVVAVAPAGSSTRVQLFDGDRLTPRWSVSVPGRFTRVQLGDDAVYLHANMAPDADAPALRVLDRATGVESWAIDGRKLALASDKVVEDNAVVLDVEVAGDTVVALHSWLYVDGLERVQGATPFGLGRDGTPRWARRDLALDRRQPRVDVIGGRAIIGMTDTPDEVVALDPATGEDVWRWVHGNGSDDRPAVGAHSWYLTGRPVVVDPVTGALTFLGNEAVASSVTSAPGTVVFGLSTGAVVAVTDPA